VGSYKIGRHNEYVVIATAAIWNVLSPKAVFDFIKMHSNQGIGLISKLLASKVKELYVYENNAVPDITIIILYLNSSVVKYN
jgi:serine/threonine protein phosphatase PrpC